MKRYIKSNSNLTKWMEDEGLQFTSNAAEAIFITPEGKLISGFSKWADTQYDNSRDIDHRVLESLVNKSRYDANFWSDALNSTQFIMLVPENKQIMYLEDYQPTAAQQKVIDRLSNYEVMYL